MHDISLEQKKQDPDLSDEAKAFIAKIRTEILPGYRFDHRGQEDNNHL